MKITLFIVLFIFVNFSFLGQEIKLDSLKDAVNQYRLIEKKTIQEDTTAVNNLLNISVNYLRVNLDSSYYYNVSAIELSKSINWRYGEAESLGLIAEYYLKATNDFVKSIESAKESLEIFKTLFPESKGDLVVARCLDIQAKAYKNIGQFENSLSSFRKPGSYYNMSEQDILQLEGFANSNLAIASNAQAILNFLSEKQPIYQGYDATFPKSMTIEEAEELISSDKGSINFQASPNPTNSTIKFSIDAKEFDDITIVITDLQGRVIKTLKADNSVMFYQFLNVNHGVYLAHLVKNGQLDSTIKIMYVE
jgi:hypothetical protein